MRKKDKVTISVVAIILIAIIGMWGLDFSSEYLTVTEVTQNVTAYIDQPVYITGNVKQGTLNVGTQETGFILTDGNADLEVLYRGDRPDGLGEGEKVSVRGILVSKNKVEANFLVMGCPSKYGV
ncbi:MAG: cytochrome c maturation protein CcmE [ANME-2 cluster archaeon]|nr:cytochrome c maturation protein CcmE [ANME-2 cluster archaeon]MBC2701449.1 cytochrome c maturation protein CcmE [ANME-2 cluster archaeon]MBC2706962.1 cytochrome c maturation protein CcmE [ANME-2 cluster archaeon]MBC2746024.1 cytochrome c maturation protein CcmE [ANME-2 cluster archaeon]MBC2762140.1 cytochrome c maturation protein CcmE [ANME-2 cluster archaeon]